MKLNKILEKVDYTKICGNEEVEISDLAYDSREVSDGYLYVAIVGNNVDGHDYIASAIDNGAQAIVVSKDR